MRGTVDYVHLRICYRILSFEAYPCLESGCMPLIVCWEHFRFHFWHMERRVVLDVVLNWWPCL